MNGAGTTNPAFTHRLARREDIPAIEQLMTAAIRELLREFLPAEAVEASFDIMGLDTQLIDDGTYYVIECEGAIAGCGGWSRRATLFGGNHSAGQRRRPCSIHAPIRRGCAGQCYTSSLAHGAVARHRPAGAAPV